MRKKKWLVIILTAILFVSASILGVSTVYRVREVTVLAPIVSEEAKTEAAELQEALNEAYYKDGIFSVDSEKAEQIVSDFPYFRITSFKKDYPNRLVVEVREDAEVYAVQKGAEYYILNAQGTLLGVRDNYINRSDKGDNLLVFGANLTVDGKKGKTLESDPVFKTLIAFCGRLSDGFLSLDAESSPRGIRGNILSVEIMRPVVNERETVFKLTTEEGVCIFVRTPSVNTNEKAEIALEAYTGLSDLKKTTGVIVVWDGTGGVKADYYEDLDALE
jgi:hypothetical protein